MCDMKEKKLTKTQEDKIAEIKSKWAEEVNKIENSYRQNTLSNKANRHYKELEEKYSKMIQEVIDNC